jgi:hypothetical protein
LGFGLQRRVVGKTLRIGLRRCQPRSTPSRTMARLLLKCGNSQLTLSGVYTTLRRLFAFFQGQ